MTPAETRGEGPIVFEVSYVLPGTRLDAYIASLMPEKLSRSKVQDLIRSGDILVNGKRAKPSDKIAMGDSVRITIPEERPVSLLPEDIPLNVVYEDDDVSVINKGRGMVVHPGAGHKEGTLVHALLSLYPDLPRGGGEERPGIVHRIDKDTTGLIVVAKSERALHSLQQQMKEGTVTREYLALCKGRLRAQEGTVDAPVGRHPKNRKKMAVVNAGRPATTKYKVVAGFGTRYTLLRVSLQTGRTHQIRVHMAHLRCPIVGDPVYSRTKGELGLDAQALHAYRLGFRHPTTGEDREFTAPLPHDFSQALKTLSKRYKEELPSWL